MKVPALVSGLAFVISAHAANPAPAPTLHSLMKDVVAVETQVVWDLSNNAQDENGNPDASKLKAADWARLSRSATKVKDAAAALAQTEHVIAARGGEKLQDEGLPGAFNAQAVQRVIDGRPAVFRGFASQLELSMNAVIAAAMSHDAAKLNDVADRIDQVCEQCHKQFWYPDQKSPR